jgi:hypothetical protein
MICQLEGSSNKLLIPEITDIEIRRCLPSIVPIMFTHPLFVRSFRILEGSPPRLDTSWPLLYKSKRFSDETIQEEDE